MKLLNQLISLHERTKSDFQRSGRVGLSKRLYVRTYEINRIGKKYDDKNRNDVSTDLILCAYLARKIYINEKFKNDKFLLEEDYINESKFTLG